MGFFLEVLLGSPLVLRLFFRVVSSLLVFALLGLHSDRLSWNFRFKKTRDKKAEHDFHIVSEGYLVNSLSFQLINLPDLNDLFSPIDH